MLPKTTSSPVAIVSVADFVPAELADDVSNFTEKLRLFPFWRTLFGVKPTSENNDALDPVMLPLFSVRLVSTALPPLGSGVVLLTVRLSVPLEEANNVAEVQC